MSLVGDYPKTPISVIDTTKVSRMFKDWMEPYNSSHWIVTKIGSGTIGSLSSPHGELLVANSASDNDSLVMQSANSVFNFVSGRETFLKARMKLTNLVQSAFLLGLITPDTTPLNNSNGVYFHKPDGVATLDGYVKKDSSESKITAMATLVANTYVELAFLYDGATTVIFYVNGIRKGSLTNTNLPTGDLNFTLVMENGTAASSAVTFDFVEAGQERP